MIRTSAAALAFLLLAAPAQAYCPALPDGPETSYLLNREALALCQQAELAAETERLRQEAALREMMMALEMRQRAVQIQLMTPPPL